MGIQFAYRLINTQDCLRERPAVFQVYNLRETAQTFCRNLPTILFRQATAGICSLRPLGPSGESRASLRYFSGRIILAGHAPKNHPAGYGNAARSPRAHQSCFPGGRVRPNSAIPTPSRATSAGMSQHPEVASLKTPPQGERFCPALGVEASLVFSHRVTPFDLDDQDFKGNILFKRTRYIAVQAYVASSKIQEIPTASKFRGTNRRRGSFTHGPGVR